MIKNSNNNKIIINDSCNQLNNLSRESLKKYLLIIKLKSMKIMMQLMTLMNLINLVINYV